jgi:hypothetical protein
MGLVRSAIEEPEVRAMVVAVAGRRIDATDAKVPRFPFDRVPLVERRLDELFDRVAATDLVASAACGADLLALTVAGRRGMRRRVVLPFDRARFRDTSVTDRPGGWGPAYDEILAELTRTDGVVTLDGDDAGDAAYLAANERILDEASAMARASSAQVVALLIWEGASRGAEDVTAAFGDKAARRADVARTVPCPGIGTSRAFVHLSPSCGASSPSATSSTRM